MITIFSIPKPFSKDICIIQTNSIKSWLKANPNGKIILFGDEPGIKEVTSSDQRITQVTQIQKNKNGTPIVSDIFVKAQRLAKGELICYLASDIILTSDFQSVEKKLHEHQSFLALGRRTDLDLQVAVDFKQPNWEKKLLMQVRQKGRLHGCSALDVMIFPRRLKFTMPNFLIGRPGWDDPFVYQLIKKGVLIIDVTPVLTAIHQNHNYNHHRQGKIGVWKGEEAQYNIKLAGGFSKMATIRNARLLLTPQGLVRPPLLRRIYATVSLISPCRQIIGLRRWWLHKKFLT